MSDVKCEHCGRVFTVPPIRVKRGVRFCSKACAGGWSEHELDLIRRWYAAHNGRPVDAKKLAKMMNRTEAAVSLKASRMGLTHSARPKKRQLDLFKGMRPNGRVDTKRYSDVGRAELQSKRAKERIATNGHPRGMLGLVHTEETKAKLAAASKAMWADPSAAVNSEAHRQRRSDIMAARQRTDPRMRRGYSRGAQGRRPDLGDVYFRSSWEANYARYLNWLVARGAILSWAYEPQTFWFEAIKRGTRSYTPDFRVDNTDGTYEWHEVKGWMDQKSVTRLTRMAKYYPEERIEVIGVEWFRKARRNGIAHMIPNWEFVGRRATPQPEDGLPF